MKRSISVGRRSGIGVLGIAVVASIFMAASTANAVQRYAFGTNTVLNPSTVDNNERGPWRLSELINTAGPDVAVGNAFTMAAVSNLTSGSQMRSFPGVAAVAQNSFAFRTSRSASAMLFAGGGAAATEVISFCPPIDDPIPANGNLNCTEGANNPGAGNYQAFIGIDQVRTAGGAVERGGFGGTLKLARNVSPAVVWFAQTPFIPTGNTTQIGVFSRKPNTNTFGWTNGRTNFFHNEIPNLKGPLYSGMLTYVSAGESGKLASVMFQSPAPPPTRKDSKGWGFQLTTGIVSGSDNTPAPTSFIFTGDDTVSGTGTSAVRNIVLVGGGVAVSNGGPQSLPFARIGILDLTVVPEPIAVGGLAAGALGLLALSRYRRR